MLADDSAAANLFPAHCILVQANFIMSALSFQEQGLVWS